MSEQASEKMIRDAAGNNEGLSSAQFARLKGVGIEVVSRWRRGEESMPSGWAFLEGKWMPNAQENYKGKIPVTVEDLIKELQKLKPEAIVLIEDHETGNTYKLDAIVSGGNSICLRFNDED